VQSIKELLSAGLVIEQTADRFAFREALTREAVSASLLLRERNVLHRLKGETIDRVRLSSRARGELRGPCLQLF
jgi:hypothetical protein